MISVDVRMDAKSEAFLRDMAKTFPREVRSAFGRACSIVRRRMQGAMTNKPKKKAAVRVQKWGDFTMRYRATEAVAYRKMFGGMLVFPEKKQISLVPEGKDAVRIGWVDKLIPSAQRFQDGGSEPTSPSWRHWLYKRGFAEGDVPKVADTPPRPVVDPVAADATANVADWTLGAFANLMRRKADRLDISIPKNAATREGYLAAATNADRMRGVA